MSFIKCGRDNIGFTESVTMNSIYIRVGGEIMNIKLSKNIGFQVKDIEKAHEFYENVLGLTQPNNSDVEEIEYRTDYNNIFLIPGEENLGPVMEMIVEDLSQAKNYLLENGFTIIRWEGKGKDCYVKDPNGMVFNVWEEK